MEATALQGDAHEERHATADRKKPQPLEVGVKYHDYATGTFPRERLPSRKPSRSPGSRHIPTLCTFPREHPSVVFADFVPLTVAGQRWLLTIFPAHSV